MTVFLVHWTGIAEDIRVMRFIDVRSAQEFELPNDRSGFEVETEADLSDSIKFSRSVLTRIYNALADSPVNKMETQEVAKRRLFALLVKKFSNIPLTTKESTMSEHTHQDPKAAKAAAKAAKAAEKAAAEATKAATTEPKGPGVIATLKELLQEGGGTVDELFEALKGRFPDRGDGMLTTIKVQLQALPKKGFSISKEKNEDGKTVYSAAA